MSNRVAMMYRTLPEVLQRRVDAGEISERDRDQILTAYSEADRILSAGEVRRATRAADIRLTAEGRRQEQLEDALRVKEEVAPMKARIVASQREHDAFQERAPFMVRLPSGGYSDTRGEQRELSPEEKLVHELRDRERREHLRTLDAAARGALLRQIADSGQDPDALLETARRAPSFMNLIDARTREYVTDAHLRRQGLDKALERSAFKADALRHLGEAIDQTLADLGAPGEPELLRSMPDGSHEPLTK